MEWQGKILFTVASFIGFLFFGDCSTEIHEYAAAKQQLHFIVKVAKTSDSGSAVRNCSGALLSAQHVITAGDCVDLKNVTNVRVIAGNAAMWKDPLQGSTYTAKSVQRHPKFTLVNDRVTTQFNYDVAVIRLTKPVPLGKQASTIKLTSAKARPAIGDKLKVAGFGITDWGEDVSKVSLRMKRGQIISRKECSKKLLAAITPQEFCLANSPDNGVSGSPAFIGNVLYGIMSWGSSVFADLAAPEINSFIKANVRT